VGDLQGKGATLHNMAQVYLTRGDLNRALELYEESLHIREQVGDLQGKGATLSMMSNVFWERKEYDQAETLMREAVEIAQKVGDAQGIAISTIKLGQLLQARGNIENAKKLYLEGLKLLENLEMQREIQQVSGLLAQLDGGPPQSPLQAAVARARAAAQAGDFAAAIAAQEEAVALLRRDMTSPPENDALVALSVLLYNLAGYYQQANRHGDAVRAFEEVVALDEQTAHPDLESDRQALQAARRLASLSPEERARLQQAAQEAEESSEDEIPPELRAQLEQQLAAMSPAERAALEAAARQFAQMSPAEHQALQIRQLTENTREAALAVLRGQADRDAVLPQIEHFAAQAAEGEEPGSPWDEAARFLRAAAAVLKGEPVPFVPAAYAAALSAILDAAKSGQSHNPPRRPS
jgi:tetratricopeptide (TPR) repeat protein